MKAAILAGLLLLSGCGYGADQATQYSVTLIATIYPATAPGSVAFFDGARQISEAPVILGSAETEVELAAGTHTLTAQFTSSSAAYGDSASAAVDYDPSADPSFMREVVFAA